MGITMHVCLPVAGGSVVKALGIPGEREIHVPPGAKFFSLRIVCAAYSKHTQPSVRTWPCLEMDNVICCIFTLKLHVGLRVPVLQAGNIL